MTHCNEYLQVQLFGQTGNTVWHTVTHRSFHSMVFAVVYLFLLLIYFYLMGKVGRVEGWYGGIGGWIELRYIMWNSQRINKKDNYQGWGDNSSHANTRAWVQIFKIHRCKTQMQTQQPSLGLLQWVVGCKQRIAGSWRVSSPGIHNIKIPSQTWWEARADSQGHLLITTCSLWHMCTALQHMGTHTCTCTHTHAHGHTHIHVHMHVYITD